MHDWNYCFLLTWKKSTTILWLLQTDPRKFEVKKCFFNNGRFTFYDQHETMKQTALNVEFSIIKLY